jgi:hypothetical protein
VDDVELAAVPVAAGFVFGGRSREKCVALGLSGRPLFSPLEDLFAASPKAQELPWTTRNS